MPEAARKGRVLARPGEAARKAAQTALRQARNRASALKVLCLLRHLFQTLLVSDSFDPENFLSLFREMRLLQKEKSKGDRGESRLPIANYWVFCLS